MMRKVHHKLLGECLYTVACKYLDSTNPDNSTIHVEHDGEIKEVSRGLVRFNRGLATGQRKSKLKQDSDRPKSVTVKLHPATIALFNRIRGRKSQGKYITMLINQKAKDRSMV